MPFSYLLHSRLFLKLENDRIHKEKEIIINSTNVCLPLTSRSNRLRSEHDVARPTPRSRLGRAHGSLQERGRGHVWRDGDWPDQGQPLLSLRQQQVDVPFPGPARPATRVPGALGMWPLNCSCLQNIWPKKYFSAPWTFCTVCVFPLATSSGLGCSRLLNDAKKAYLLRKQMPNYSENSFFYTTLFQPENDGR